MVVWRLEHRGRKLKDLLGFVKDMEAQSRPSVSLIENMNSTSTMCRPLLQFFGTLADYTKGLIREQWPAGAASARAQPLVMMPEKH